VILFAGVNVPFECGMCTVHDFSLLAYIFSCLPSGFIIPFMILRDCKLLFEVLIYGSDFLLQHCKVLFNGWLAILNEQVYLLNMIFLSG
jgi:hypothetical protein